MLSFFGDGRNSFSRMLDKYFALTFEMGATGIFHDEFPHSNYAYTYLHKARWDNRSVILRPGTLEVAAVVSSLVLLTNAHELALAKFVADRGGKMVCNGAPHTRSWYQQAVASSIPPNSEARPPPRGFLQSRASLCANAHSGLKRAMGERWVPRSLQ